MTTGARTWKPILAIAACLAAAPAGPAPAAPPRAAGEAREEAALERLRARLPRSRVDRPRDLVIIKGRKLVSSMGAAPINRIRVMAFRLGEDWVVIPQQIDERDDGGDWIWPATPGPGARESAEGEGMLTPEDEILFRPKDLGVRVARTAWPEGARSGREIEVRDPLGGGRGWAYLFSFDDPPPLPAFDEVRAYASTVALGDSFVTPFYRVFYPRRGGRFVPGVMTELAIDGSGGERHGPNLLDREKLRYAGSDRLLPRVEFRRHEDGIEARPLGVIDGPLRAVRKIERRVRFRAWFDGKVEATASYLPDRIILEEPDGVPAAMAFLVRGATAHFYWDFEAPPGSTVFAAPIPRGVPADGTESPVEQALEGLPSAWWALRTPRNGAILAVYRPAVAAVLPSPDPPLVFRDGAAPDPPERAAGGRPAIGWRLSTDEQRRPGGRPGEVHLFVLEDFGPGAEKAVLRRLRAPLRVTAGPGLAR